MIGAGGQFGALQSPFFVCVTDGAPRDMFDASRLGFDSREAYAQARGEEFKLALATAGIGPERFRLLGFVDQEVALDLPALTEAVRQLISELRPDLVLTHAYEGGHPDHDAVAFAVHAAQPPTIMEMTGYHLRNGRMQVGEFLPGDNTGITVALNAKQRTLKRQLLNCYRTQQEMVRNFPIGLERFRPAPQYNFRQPPHAGRLFYEQFSWGMTASRWCELAAAAQEAPV